MIATGSRRREWQGTTNNYSECRCSAARRRAIPARLRAAYIIVNECIVEPEASLLHSICRDEALDRRVHLRRRVLSHANIGRLTAEMAALRCGAFESAVIGTRSISRVDRDRLTEIGSQHFQIIHHFLNVAAEALGNCGAVAATKLLDAKVIAAGVSGAGRRAESIAALSVRL